jgi:hypothetical protein
MDESTDHTTALSDKIYELLAKIKTHQEIISSSEYPNFSKLFQAKAEYINHKLMKRLIISN